MHYLAIMLAFWMEVELDLPWVTPSGTQNKSVRDVSFLGKRTDFVLKEIEKG